LAVGKRRASFRSCFFEHGGQGLLQNRWWSVMGGATGGAHGALRWRGGGSNGTGLCEHGPALALTLMGRPVRTWREWRGSTAQTWRESSAPGGGWDGVKLVACHACSRLSRGLKKGHRSARVVASPEGCRPRPAGQSLPPTPRPLGVRTRPLGVRTMPLGVRTMPPGRRPSRGSRRGRAVGAA
jgi:hypothetical protein